MKIQAPGGKVFRENVGMIAQVIPPAVRAVACVWLIGSASIADAQPRLTFTNDIASIVCARSAPCHRPGAIGPCTLPTYANGQRRGTQIAEVTRRRVMPPWKPEPGKG